ncbi:MAG: NADH:flavin oxidoreductase/NADH oxidase family protein [Spirochaetaceae bacterium]|nr:MAG: NADH:flavin oxidoreductase/NADH oxidase family protein [Spirochaetaceae bacterium]
MNHYSDTDHILAQPLELPCGTVLKNRLVKSPMSDSLGNGEGNPTEAQKRLYERWAEGGIAVSMIGEVQGDPRFPERPGNLVLGAHTDRPAMQALIRRATVTGAQLWPQLGHAGALSYGPISHPKGPSALNIEGLQCAGMTRDEIQQLPGMYATTALHAKTLGFNGVHLHAGHGFLLSQFLSPLFNHRNDEYGGSIQSRCRIVLEIIDAMRAAVGPSFPVGIRINSSDKLDGGLTEADAIEVIRLLDQVSIDLIDISGGTYFPGAKASSEGSGRGPYFVDFARRAKEITKVPLMVTGGFKTHEHARAAVADGATDIVGLGRALVLDPRLASIWLAGRTGDPDFPGFESPPTGGITAWYTMRLTALGEDREDEFTLDLASAIRVYEERDLQRCVTWRHRLL